MIRFKQKKHLAALSSHLWSSLGQLNSSNNGNRLCEQEEGLGSTKQ